MKNIKLIIASLLIVMTTACGYNTGGGTTEPVAYLYFSGEAIGAEVFVDNDPGFIIQATGNKNQYKITPGKHLIVIKRNGQTLVKRSVMLGDGHEKEFNVPRS